MVNPQCSYERSGMEEDVDEIQKGAGEGTEERKRAFAGSFFTKAVFTCAAVIFDRRGIGG